MNIFVVDSDPVVAAKMLCDKHVVKMVTESAQLLSTCHRVLDGVAVRRPSNTGKRTVTHWILPNSIDSVFMKAVSINHPCSIWVRQSVSNYNWLYMHYKALSDEYTSRYGKEHGGFYNNDIGQNLVNPPNNLVDIGLTPFAVAINPTLNCIVYNDPVASYRRYYIVDKARFATWKNSETPKWFVYNDFHG